MIIIPVDQSVAGDGNTTRKDIYTHTNKSLHLVYLNADGTIYNGANSASLSIYASNEEAWEPADIIAAVKIGTVTLDASTPARLYDVVGTYNHIKIILDSIPEGKITAFYTTREA